MGNDFHPTRKMERLEHGGEGAGFLRGHTAAKAAAGKQTQTS